MNAIVNSRDTFERAVPAMAISIGWLERWASGRGRGPCRLSQR